MTQPPATEEELMHRALNLQGRSLADVAREQAFQVPPDLRGHKGWVGHLIEAALGTSAGSRGEPDFPHLGIELKTMPVDAQGVPMESTWVCIAPLDGSLARTWEQSRVRHKLAAVLWVPVQGSRDLLVPHRRVGTPFLWRPTPDQEALIQEDWEFHAEVIGLGELWQLDARKGEVLQIRPKGARGTDRVWTTDDEGERVADTPRGFYLRRSFTRTLITNP